MAAEKSILNEKDADKRSLKELLIYGLKGAAAYTDHAYILGLQNDDIYKFTVEALSATTKDLNMNEYINLVNKCGTIAVKAMALLDSANTSTYGNPVITKVKIDAGDRPGILVSGHDLKDLYELLEQSQNQGIDIYTHSEMLPAHYYPALKKFDHLYGNYGSSWWNQAKEFESFNGPILMTTNCITNVRETYKSRFFTTGAAGWPETKHITDRINGGSKDFSEIIAIAKNCNPPTKLEEGYITGGFARNQLMELADSILKAVKEGKIKKFIVMAGCDGRHKSREYYSEVAKKLPNNTVILTAGCAKYRYIKLNLGEIDGIPRVIDAGQCNDSYSLAFIALKLKEILGLDDINKLPIAYDIAWYEQKAVCVLLGLLSLGVNGIILCPTLPGFLSENVAKVLINTFDLKGITTADSDIKEMLA
jgi:hydroxylamine reductase